MALRTIGEGRQVGGMIDLAAERGGHQFIGVHGRAKEPGVARFGANARGGNGIEQRQHDQHEAT